VLTLPNLGVVDAYFKILQFHKNNRE
jgi:hypothetical protein